MNYQTYSLPKSFSPDGKLAVYIQDTPQSLLIKTRPLVLICPGGGYRGVANRESEPLALPFLSMGCHVAILTYSVAPHRHPTQLKEAAWSVQFLRSHAEEWHIDPKKLLILGCSAGGHLAAHLGTSWQEPWLSDSLDTTPDAIRPDGMILCYPVITSGEHRNIGSFESLLGEDPDPQLWKEMSLEHKVSHHTPPAFIWHTFEDTCVPPQNSLLFVSAMKRAGVTCEFHLFPYGAHGLSLATEQTANEAGIFIQKECAVWINLVKPWIENL